MRIWCLLLLVLLAGCSGDLISEPAAGGSGATPAEEQARVLSEAQYRVVYRTTSDWGTGFTGEIEIVNRTARRLDNWRLQMDFDPELTSIWNGRIASRTGNRYVLRGESHNRSLEPRGRIKLGFQGTPGAVRKPTGYRLTGALGPPPGGAATGGATTGGATTGGGPTGGAATGGATTGGPVASSGYFHTDGARIVDAQGQTVRLTGVNWFGLETGDFAPHGLWARSLDSMMEQMAAEGYNCLRLPYSNELFETTSRPAAIDFALNPELQGLTGLQIMDRIVEEAGSLGMRVILDRHRPTGAGQSALWYTDAVSEERWISDWERLALRYRDNPTVIGCDLHNEPHDPATWGDDNPATDWRLAAQRCGNRILAVNPKLLIFVEGVQSAGGRTYWWGGNLKNAGAHPVVLSVPNRLVYSTHDYPASVHEQTWFSDPSYPDNLPALWDECWGYLVKQEIAPVLVGEFGTRHQTERDRQWLASLTAYLQANAISFTYWSWNPNSSDTGGLLGDDWTTVLAEKKAVLAPLLAPML